MPNKPKTVKHASRSLERHVMARREPTWSVLLAELERGAARVGESEAVVETVLSLEPPWRRSSKLEGATAGLDLCEGTFVIRDDGSECHLSWGVVLDPEPSDAGWEFLDSAIKTIEGVLDRVVAVAEAG